MHYNAETCLCPILKWVCDVYANDCITNCFSPSFCAVQMGLKGNMCKLSYALMHYIVYTWIQPGEAADMNDYEEL